MSRVRPPFPAPSHADSRSRPEKALSFGYVRLRRFLRSPFRLPHLTVWSSLEVAFAGVELTSAIDIHSPKSFDGDRLPRGGPRSCKSATLDEPRSSVERGRRVTRSQPSLLVEYPKVRRSPENLCEWELRMNLAARFAIVMS